jgi:hypothetical protein
MTIQKRIRLFIKTGRGSDMSEGRAVSTEGQRAPEWHLSFPLSLGVLEKQPYVLRMCADALGHCYSPPFVSSHEPISKRLLCYDMLLNSIRRFYASVFPVLCRHFIRDWCLTCIILYYPTLFFSMPLDCTRKMPPLRRLKPCLQK